jgi:type II secretory pathway component PulF
MGTNILEERMLEDTLTTFQKGDEVSVAQGVMLIDGWLQALQGDANQNQLGSQLTELRVELQSGQPNSEHIRKLLESLANQAQQAAERLTAEGTWTGGLESLSKILRNLGSKL